MHRVRFFFVALVVVAAVGLVPTAQAAPGGPMTAASGTFTGTSGDDLLVIGRDGDLLTHNRFAAGDPGFASGTDFDSSSEGVQTRTISGGYSVSFYFEAGDDTLKLNGTFPDDVISLGTFGTGTDTIDASSYSQSATVGLVMGTGTDLMRYTDVERVIGSPLNDTIQGSNEAGASPLTVEAGSGDDVIYGTAGNDVLNGGGGRNEIHARQGQDTVGVAAPLPAAVIYVDVPGGDDTFVLTATGGDDDLGFAVVPTDGGPQFTALDFAQPNGGYALPSDLAAARVELGGGNDSLLLDAAAPATVDGGGGSDEIAINANGATASVVSDGGDKVVTLPRFLYFSQGHPTPLRLKQTEALSIFNETMLVTAPGPGGGPHIRGFRADGAPVTSFFAYAPSFTGGVSVAMGDVDGDYDDEIVTGAGPGGGPHVRVFHSDGSDTGVGFFAYDPSFHGGVNVAAIDLDGDGFSEIVTAPARGGGPHVRIWSGDGELLEEWMAPGFSDTGLHLARGSTFGQLGGDQILLSSAAGNSLVRALEVDGSPTDQFADFVPYPGFGGGASVSRGAFFEPQRGPDYLDGYHAGIVTGAGPGGGPHVRVVATATQGKGYADNGGFYAYDPNFHGGVAVTTCNADGREDEVVTAAGPGGGPHVRMFGRNGSPRTLSFFAYDPNFSGGVRLACGGAESKAY